MTLKTTGIFTTLLGAALLLPAQESKTYTYSYSGAALPIFRDSANIITVANLFFPRAIMVTKVTAQVEISYPWPGDINVYMYSPLLTRTKLLERNCGTEGSVSDITFDDAAATKFSDACPTAAGPYQGNEPLSNYNGQVALGTWSIAVENNGSDSTVGYLRGFTLTITGTPVTTKPITGPNAIFNAASFQSGSVAPGEMINIQGVNLGPATAETAPAGDLPTSLGGVSVMFDSAPAAVSYVSPNVVTAQVPFSLTPGTKTSMTVTSSVGVGDPVSLDVVASVPGIYTNSGNGLGIAQAVNPDGTLNSATNPVDKGQYVTLYAAGLGTVTPALNTGQAPPPSASNTTTPYSAVVDGITTSVQYAGAAPTFPGLYQLNILVPMTARSGVDAVTIFAGGGTPSQDGVSIFVR